MAKNSQTAKAPADYVKLAENAEIMAAGREAIDAKLRKELNRLMADVPARAAIMQAFERFADNRAALLEARAKLDRYVALRDRPPVDDHSADS